MSLHIHFLFILPSYISLFLHISDARKPKNISISLVKILPKLKYASADARFYFFTPGCSLFHVKIPRFQQYPNEIIQYSPCSNNGCHNSTLVALLQLKYQATTETPFTTHPYTMTTAVFTAFGYYLAGIAQLTYSSTPRLMGFAHHCMVWFGTISVASLASIFFSDPMRPLLYFLSVLMSSGELFDMLNQSRFMEDLRGRGFHRRFMRKLGRISSFGRAPILPS